MVFKMVMPGRLRGDSADVLGSGITSAGWCAVCVGRLSTDVDKNIPCICVHICTVDTYICHHYSYDKFPGACPGCLQSEGEPRAARVLPGRGWPGMLGSCECH